MKIRRTVTDLALSVLAGYVGTKAMEPVSMKLYQLEPTHIREREDAARPGAPYQMAAEKVSAMLGVKLDDRQLQRASMALHYGLAVQWAPLYAVLRNRTGWSPVTSGLATGTAMSIVADELMTPAFGFSAPNTEYPLATHARGVVAHLVYGLAVAATFETGWALLRREERP
jgi:uncharacterized membrane protein YagU involved in acid resistance